MKEDQIIDTLTQFLINKGFTVNNEDVKKGNSPGVDILARKRNVRWFIEVKGGTIGREDVAEEILRVCLLPDPLRSQWYGHGVYLVDLKSSAKHT